MDRDGLGGVDHAVERLDSEGEIANLSGANLSGPATGMGLGPDQVLVATHGGFGVVVDRLTECLELKRQDRTASQLPACLATSTSVSENVGALP